MSEVNEQSTSSSWQWGYSFAEVAEAFSSLATSLTLKPHEKLILDLRTCEHRLGKFDMTCTCCKAQWLETDLSFTLENDDGMLFVLPHE